MKRAAGGGGRGQGTNERSGSATSPTFRSSGSSSSLLSRMLSASGVGGGGGGPSHSPKDRPSERHRNISSGPNSPRSTSSSYRRTMLRSDSDRLSSDKAAFLEKYSAKLAMFGYTTNGKSSSLESRNSSRGGTEVAALSNAMEGAKRTTGNLSTLASMVPWPFQGTATAEMRSTHNNRREPSSSAAIPENGSDTNRRSSIDHEEEKTQPDFTHSLYQLSARGKPEPKDPCIRASAKVQQTVLAATTDYVYACLKYYYKMRDIYIPSRSAPASCKILATENWKTATRLLVIISSQGIRYGSMLPYVDTAVKHDYGVIICHPIDNMVTIKDPTTGTEKATPIEGSATPEAHVLWVYDHMVVATGAEHVFLLGYGQAGRLCKQVLLRYLTLKHMSLNCKPITGIALIESSSVREVNDANDVNEFMSSRSCNWMRSQLPSGRALGDQAAQLGVGSCLSLGSSGPENQSAYSAFLALREVFTFYSKLVAVLDKRSPRLRMPNLMEMMHMSSRGSKKVLPSGEDDDRRSQSQLRPLSTRRTDDMDNGSRRGSNVSVSAEVMVPRADSWSSLLDRTECLTVDDFFLEKVVGKGAFGKVMMVRLVGDETRKVYAMKVIKKNEIVRRGYVDSTKLERSILCKADHPFVVRLRFAFQTTQKLYLVTDFYNGGNLLVHLKRSYTFPEPVARFFASEVFTAIEYLHHRNIVYRDLKPENVLMEYTGHVALTDFGLSKFLFAGQKTSTFCGTAEYLAPEQLRRVDYNRTVDWWAFGVFTYELLVGRSPFYNKSRTTMYEHIVGEDPPFPPNLSPEAVSLITGLLTKNPNKRLGAEGSQAIRAHPFFKPVDWQHLLRKEMIPPLDPDIAKPDDCKYISSRYLSMDARDSGSGGESPLQRFTDFTFIGDEQFALPPPSSYQLNSTTSSGCDITRSSSGVDLNSSSSPSGSRTDDFSYERGNYRKRDSSAATSPTAAIGGGGGGGRGARLSGSSLPAQVGGMDSTGSSAGSTGNIPMSARATIPEEETTPSGAGDSNA